MPPRLDLPSRLYRALTGLLAPVTWLRAWRSARRTGAPADSLSQKMGRGTTPRPAGPVLWLCGSGMGELTMARPIVAQIQAIWPETALVVTPKSLRNVAAFAKLFRADAIFQCRPSDTPGVARRFCDHWRPDFVLWIRSGPTLNFSSALKPIGTGQAILQASRVRHGRLFRRLFRAMFHEVFADVKLAVPQSEAVARQFAELSVPNIQRLGDLRNCAAPLRVDGAELDRVRDMTAGRPLWVAASTRDDEYLLAARVHRHLARRHPNLLTLVVPRRVTDGQRMCARLRAIGHTVGRRTAGEQPGRGVEVYVADTFGELGLWYRLSPIAFVGGTFARKGGHNVVEPARLGAAVVCGPDVRNIAAIASDMVKAGALRQVSSEDELASTVDRWLDDPVRLAADRASAVRFAEASAMSSDRIFAALHPHLERAFGPTVPAA